MGVRSLLRRVLKRTSTSGFQFLPGVLGDGRLSRCLTVTRNGREVFRLRDFGQVTRMRASTFETKEPETLSWIEGFSSGDTLLDVGANIGVFSLYAASRGCEVVAVEPDALNFALLNENIRLNSATHLMRVTAYPLALHNALSVSQLNVTSGEWGSALSSFDRAVDYKGSSFTPLHSQGSIGMSLDEFVDMLGFQPSHLKVDVDGNELFVLQGARSTLGGPKLRSLLIELDERRTDYRECLRLLTHSGFKLVEKTQGAAVSTGVFAGSYNHIFQR